MYIPTQGKESIVLEEKKKEKAIYEENVCGMKEIREKRKKRKKKVTSSDLDHFPVPGINISWKQTLLSALDFNANSWFITATSFTLIVSVSIHQIIPH